MVGLLRQAISAIALGTIIATSAAASPQEDGRVAIVDISQSLVADSAGKPIAPVFDHLHKSGVLVIGRYFSRCPQIVKGKLWRKRLIDGDPKRPDGEARAILDNGFAIMSIYQYNNREAKFAGTFKGRICGETKYAKEITSVSLQAREGILDAEAALAQAAAVKQPKKTVIYFGVDYGYTSKNREQTNGLLAYFREVKKQFDAADYRIGAYADGEALTVLMGDNPQKEKLIDIAWLLPSASFPGNSDFHTRKPWHLFQSQADNKILISNDGKCAGLEYDVNIQNVAAANADLGFWDKNGAYKVPELRTKAIFDQRRFVCDRQDLSLLSAAQSCTDKPAPRSCARTANGEPCFARTVRLDPGQAGNGSPKIDFRDYGRFDGSIEQRRLTKSFAVKPLYEAAPRDAKACQ